MTASDTSHPAAPRTALRPPAGPRPAADQPGIAHEGDLYGRALLSRLTGRTGSSWQVRDSTGGVRSLSAALDRWLGRCDPADHSVLDRCTGLTLDVGCGPGRLVAALAATGRQALGIDVNDVAVRLARGRGGAATRADVFAAVPGEGAWDTVVLLDGNLGIGGDPARLLARCAELLAPGGRVLVEASPPERASGRGRRRLETDGEAGPWFPWATVDVDGIAAAAPAAALGVRETWTVAGRTFAALGR